jgi:beta-lactam-binding protein with PASTA domain
MRMGFFYFLGRKKFYIHLLIIILLSLAILFAVLKSLDVYTRHGDVFVVPDFYGKTVEQLKENHFDEYFQLMVIDSVFDNKHDKGVIMMQNPGVGSKVKQGRKVYLTVVAQMPEKTTVPNLKNLSLRQAMVTLDRSKLNVGRLEYVDYYARNAVIDQKINDETVEDGTEINTGTNIDLTVGKGRMQVKAHLPLLIGMGHGQVKRALNYASLNLGQEYFLDGEDTKHARVYKTKPDLLETQTVELGQNISVWYRSDEHFDFDELLLKYKSDTLSTDTTQFENYPTENEN